MEWNERLYLGTWQLSGDFRALSFEEKERLVTVALESGIVRFDTAAVYGGGSVESLLGRMLPHDAVIVTKIPAIRSSEGKLTSSFGQHYPVEHVKASLEDSLSRLSRTSLDVVLLHNWHETWAGNIQSVADVLFAIRDSGLVNRVGMSLPDGFRGDIGTDILDLVDVIEAPLNQHERWIEHMLSDLRASGVEVLLRSLFMQGMRLKTAGEARLLQAQDVRRQRDYPSYEGPVPSAQSILTEALSLGTSLVIGATTPEQITTNVNRLKGEHHGLKTGV